MVNLSRLFFHKSSRLWIPDWKVEPQLRHSVIMGCGSISSRPSIGLASSQVAPGATPQVVASMLLAPPGPHPTHTPNQGPPALTSNAAAADAASADALPGWYAATLTLRTRLVAGAVRWKVAPRQVERAMSTGRELKLGCPPGAPGVALRRLKNKAGVANAAFASSARAVYCACESDESCPM